MANFHSVVLNQETVILLWGDFREIGQERLRVSVKKFNFITQWFAFVPNQPSQQHSISVISHDGSEPSSIEHLGKGKNRSCGVISTVLLISAEGSHDMT